MTRAEDRKLLRRLAGERTTDEAGGSAAAEEVEETGPLAALWAQLEPPPAEPAPPGFTGRVMARVREAGVDEGGARGVAARGDTLTRRFGAVAGRLAAASALAAGLVVGAGLGALVAAPGVEEDGRQARVPAVVDGAAETVRGEAAAAAGGAVEPNAFATSEEGGAGERPAGGRAAGAEGAAEPIGPEAVDEETLLAAAVAAATAEGAGGGEGPAAGGSAGPFVAEPDLAEGYLAALAALEEAS